MDAAERRRIHQLARRRRLGDRIADRSSSLSRQGSGIGPIGRLGGRRKKICRRLHPNTPLLRRGTEAAALDLFLGTKTMLLFNSRIHG
jgi:hypothetical protein